MLLTHHEKEGMCSELYIHLKLWLYHFQRHQFVICFSVKIQFEVESMLSLFDEACIDILSLDIIKI